MESAQTSINLIGFVFTLTMGILILTVPRRYAVLPIISTTCFITLGQVIYIAGLNFTMFRIVIFFGLVRIFLHKEVFLVRFQKIDKMLIVYAITSAIAYVLLRNGSNEAITNQLGFIYNSLFLYIVFRALIRDQEDIYRIFKMLSLAAVLLAVAMVIEKATGRNLFSVFGGVSEFTAVREGKLRCQAAFAHPILAGTFGATILPFMMALWLRAEKERWIAGLGMLSSTIITLASGSSGPAMTYLAVILGMAMWHLRFRMRAVRWTMLLSLLILHMVMKAPVWALIGKLSEVIGGTGWHRVMLIDAWIDHFDEWWLLGTDHTRHWMPTGVTWSKEHTDITNHFIAVGIHGGLISLFLFTAIIVCCFKNLGVNLEKSKIASFPTQFTLWCLGVVLVGHLVAFISVSYFDQIIVMWYLLLAMITTLSMMPTKIVKENDQIDSASQQRYTTWKGVKMIHY